MPPRRRWLALVLCAFALSPVSADEAALASLDRWAYRTFPDAFGALAASRLPRDESGLIGRNRVWGELFSPRFQLGAGSALRTALAAERPRDAARAFRAIEIGALSARPDGLLPSRLPPAIGGPPSAADTASAAAFFLGDACLGVRALEASTAPDAVVSAERRDAVRAALARALSWLSDRRKTLARVDAGAPNRLLFDALAFRACAERLDDALSRDARVAAAEFVERALALQAASGHFVEGGGHDTSYQGVALRVGEELLAVSSEAESAALSDALTSAADWLAARIDAEGQIDSSGNTRTCWSGETVFGKRKRVAVPDVFVGLAYAAARTGESAVREAAERLRRWAERNPDADPCHRG